METKVMITPERMESYRQELVRRERSDGTAERYLHALEHLRGYLGGRCAETETLLAWKGAITERYAVSTVNAMIVAVNHSGRSAAVGAITGAILGLRLGEEALPEFYIECLEPAEVLRELADDLYTGCPMEQGSKLFDLDWDYKYLHGGQ